MEKDYILSSLSSYPSIAVSIFYDYCLKFIKESQIISPKKDEFVSVFKSVASTGVFIDGDTVSLSYVFSKKTNSSNIVPSYNYQAYKNRVLLRYPETTIDLQLVHAGENYFFKKENGVVLYNHEILNPFEIGRAIVGCYCIIKNRRGQFLELINIDDISKFRASAKTQYIWNIWEGEMVKKSAIKRACKTHFKDLFCDIEKIDSENYDLENVVVVKKAKEVKKTFIEDQRLKKAIDYILTKEDASWTFERLIENYEFSESQLLEIKKAQDGKI